MHLPERQRQLWEIYTNSEQIRVRQDSLAALQDFIGSLDTLPTEEWHPWALEIARKAELGANIPVRMPLFRLVLFPALHDAFRTGTAAPVRMLASFGYLFYHSPECLALLPEEMRSVRGLLQEAIRRNPGDEVAKNKLLSVYRSSFDYSLHELPSGVLYGQDGATVAQCSELLEELDEYRNLVGGELRDAELISEANFHITAYRDYLTQEPPCASYADYLKALGIEFQSASPST